MDGPVMESWWDNDDGDPRGRTNKPTKCSCCRKLTFQQAGLDEEYLCRVHGVVVVAEKGIKRSGKTAWHYFRLFRDYTGPITQQQTLF